MNKHRELLTSIRRYYSNAFTDRAKQDAINLFLGYFVPNINRQALWELDTDYYLHNFHVENAGLQSMREYKKEQYFLDQDEVRSFTTCLFLVSHPDWVCLHHMNPVSRLNTHAQAQFDKVLGIYNALPRA